MRAHPPSPRARLLLEAAAAHHHWWPPEADWIRWTGVLIAVAGALIATPDATLIPARHWITRTSNQVRGWLARYLPFLRQTTQGELKLSMDAGLAMDASTSVSQPTGWNAKAPFTGKIERLHQQVERLTQQLAAIPQAIQASEQAMRSALEQSQVRHQDAHQQLTGRLEARERRSAQVDAHGIGPIAAGIVLTGIPGELAAVPAVGVLFIIAGIAVTFCAGRAVMTGQAI